MRGRVSLMLIGAYLLTAACGGGERSSSDTHAGASAGADSAPALHAGAGDTSAAEAAGHAHAGEGEAQALLPIMQKLGSDMTAITYALMTDDTATVARSAKVIAEHAPISAADLERIHGVLGTEMAEFERLDAAVHDASVRLSQAAEAGRTPDVLTRLNEVQTGCVACHEKFRARLRTNTAR